MTTDLSLTTDATIREQILDRLRQSSEPLSAAQLKKQFTELPKNQKSLLEGELESLLADGRIHAWSKPTARLKKFWVHAPAEYYRERIFEILSEKPATEADLLATLKEMAQPIEPPKEAVQQAIAAYLAEGTLFIAGKHLFTTDPRVAIPGALLGVLQEREDAVFSASELARRASERLGVALKPKELEPILAALAQEGRVYLHGKTKFGILPLATPEEKVRRIGARFEAVLDSQRQLGGDAYPLTLDALKQLAAPDMDAKSVSAMLSKATSFRDKVLISTPKPEPRSFVVFREDIEQLAGNAAVFEAAVRSARGARSCLVTLDKVVRGVAAEIQAPFRLHLERAMAEDNLPGAVAWIQDNQAAKLLLVEDLRPPRKGTGTSVTSANPTGARVPPSPADLEKVSVRHEGHDSRAAFARFVADFDDAFRRLDARKWNSVSLVDLRRELSAYSREQFDEHLRTLRRERRYGLTAAHERHGLGDEQRRAAIVEAGVHLLNVFKEKE